VPAYHPCIQHNRAYDFVSRPGGARLILPVGGNHGKQEKRNQEEVIREVQRQSRKGNARIETRPIEVEQRAQGEESEAGHRDRVERSATGGGQGAGKKECGEESCDEEGRGKKRPGQEGGCEKAGEKEEELTAMDRLFLEFSASKLRQLASRIESCLGMLTEEQVWERGGENGNAIGNLVLHLCGNARQWIVAGVGGSEDVRQRDAEFAARGGVARVELLDRLRGTVADACAVIETVPAARLEYRIVVQGYDQSVLEAIYHVVEHFSMHTGQILFATKILTGADLGFYRHLRTAVSHAEKTP
jgi:uncharacterized damage-inducible protein DinB